MSCQPSRRVKQCHPERYSAKDLGPHRSASLRPEIPHVATAPFGMTMSDRAARVGGAVLLCTFAVILAMGLSPRAVADEPQRNPSAAPTSAPSSDRIDSSIARGLAYLSRQQNGDGSYSGGGPRVAMTSLA